MKNRVLASMLLSVCLLSGCGGEHYTQEVKQEYESKSFSAAQKVFDSMGEVFPTMELYSPDGVTHVVAGQFYVDGLEIQYLYDGDQDILWASRTASGYTYRNALEYIEGQVDRYFQGTGISGAYARSLCWRIPYTEYRYNVQSDGESKTADWKSMSKYDSYIARPFFQYGMEDHEVEAFLEEQLRAASGTISDMSVDLFCSRFEEDRVQEEIQGQGFLQAFPGVAVFRLYEDSDDGRYYEFRRTDMETIKVTYHEKTADINGSIRWNSQTVYPSEQ